MHSIILSYKHCCYKLLVTVDDAVHRNVFQPFKIIPSSVFTANSIYNEAHIKKVMRLSQTITTSKIH